MPFTSRDKLLLFKKAAHNAYRVKCELEYINLQIEEIEYMMAGCRGIDNSRIKGNSDEAMRQMRFLEMSLKKDKLEENRDNCERYINWVFHAVDSCDESLRPYIVAAYLRGHKITKLADQINVPMRYLSQRLSKAVSDGITDKMAEEIADLNRKMGRIIN